MLSYGRRLNGKKVFSCRHIGKGQYCHRCKQVEQLEAMLVSGKSYVTDKKKPKSKTWTKEEIKAEINRLRGN